MFMKAEEFNDAVQVVRDWLPQAEAELKFRAISEDEEGILQLIDKHQVTTHSTSTTTTTIIIITTLYGAQTVHISAQ